MGVQDGPRVSRLHDCQVKGGFSRWPGNRLPERHATSPERHAISIDNQDVALPNVAF
jgi:hypothetical protein